MSDERMRILKMLKEGRITLEEAEVLLDAVGGADAEKSSAREEAPHAAEHTGAGWWGGDQQKKGPASWLDFGWKLDPAHFPSEIQEAMKGFAQSMKDAFSNIQKGDYLGGLKEMFGRVLAQTSRRESVPAAGVRRLSLKNRWGDVHISGGDAPEIGVAASISAWGADPQAAQALADSVEISHYREGDTLSLRAEAPDSGHVRFKVDFDVTVPRSLAVEVKSMSGDIVVSDAEDGVNAVNLSGDIIVQSCAGGACHRVEKRRPRGVGIQRCGTRPDDQRGHRARAGTLRRDRCPNDEREHTLRARARRGQQGQALVDERRHRHRPSRGRKLRNKRRNRLGRGTL